jgi:hypothetical protein
MGTDTLKRKYDWLPPANEQFPEHNLPAEAVVGLRNLARASDEDEMNDLIEIALTFGLRHPRFALQAVAAEREKSRVVEEMARESKRRRSELIVLGIALLTALAALLQAIASLN